MVDMCFNHCMMESEKKMGGDDKPSKEQMMKEKEMHEKKMWDDMQMHCKMACEQEMKKQKGETVYDNGFMGVCMEGCMPKKDDGKKDDKPSKEDMMKEKKMWDEMQMHCKMGCEQEMEK